MSEFQTNYKKQPVRANKVTLENIMKANDFFDEKNPITYKLYLQRRPDLSPEEVEHYKELISTLEREQKEEICITNSNMRDCKYLYDA